MTRLGGAVGSMQAHRAGDSGSNPDRGENSSLKLTTYYLTDG